MRVLIADKFEPLGLAELKKFGCHVTLAQDVSSDELATLVERVQPDVLVVRSTKVPATAISSGKRLKLIVRAGAGYDNIDLPAASREGILVATCPGKNAIAVAELTWALILAGDRRVPDQTEQLRQGQWNKKEFGVARGLYGSTLGLIGLGTIAREVLSRAKAFGMPVVVWSRSLTDEDATALGVRRLSSPIEVAAQSDVISIHVAATEATASLVNHEFVSSMRDGALLINTSRGSIVDEEALLKGIRDKGIRAGLDVYANEPAGGQGLISNPILREPGVFGTHHIGASTTQAQRAIALEAVRIVRELMNTGEAPNVVNRAGRSECSFSLRVRHRNKPGVLATVFRLLSEKQINVEEMQNILCDRAEAAIAVIQLDCAPTDATLQAMKAECPNILGLEMASRGVPHN